jgi:hypothetical protein
MFNLTRRAIAGLAIAIASGVFAEANGKEAPTVADPTLKKA